MVRRERKPLQCRRLQEADRCTRYRPELVRGERRDRCSFQHSTEARAPARLLASGARTRKSSWSMTLWLPFRAGTSRQKRPPWSLV